MSPDDAGGDLPPPDELPASAKPRSGDPRSDDPLGSGSVALYFKDTLSLQGDPEIATEPPAPEVKLPAESLRYRHIAELGRGGFATVYLVYDDQLKRTVALKLLRLAGRGREAVNRFLDEARATAQLEHPNIVPVYDTGDLKGIPFYTMKFVRGRSFASVLSSLRAGDAATAHEWSLTRLVQSLQQVAMAAHYAHEKGLVHRDLKPANVMLGAFGEVLVMDWGLSHAIACADGRRGILGTPVYMAPEQATGHLDEVDARTDVYALGVMLFEALTLRRPFEGKDIHKLLREIASMPPPSPLHVCEGRTLPPVLAAVALRALAKDKLTRHPSARAFHEDLQGWIEADTERRRRSALSAARLEDALEKLRRYRELQVDLKRAEAETGALRSRFRGPEPLEEKTPLVAAEDRVRTLRRERVRLSSGAMVALTEALAFDEANEEARVRIAEYYMLRLEEAEEAGDAEGRTFFSELVEKYDARGAFRERLRDEAWLRVDTHPPGLAARLVRHVEDGFVLLPRPERALGRTPVADVHLATGSYAVRIAPAAPAASAAPATAGDPEERREDDGPAAERRELVIPVCLSRGARVSIVARADVVPPPGFVFVPTGPFGSGSRIPALGGCSDFAIAIHPVTMEEYLAFVDAILAEASLEEARGRLPRLPNDGPPLAAIDEGSKRAVLLPGDRARGAPTWGPRFPVVGISWHDAHAYGAWRSRMDGVRLELPTSLEWEKAARGADARRYPWGDRFDPALACMKLSHPAPARPVAVDAFPLDVSPYGVRGLGGNVRDWCEDSAAEGDESLDERVVRGGAWSLGASCCDASSAGGLGANDTSSHVGFRLVWRP